MKRLVIKIHFFTLIIIPLASQMVFSADILVSEDTEVCIDCHASLNPGIVSDWGKSLHAQVTPSQGMKKVKLERLISTVKVPETLADNLVGCAECHTLNSEKHADNFEHSGYLVHSIVTPGDCAVCHPDEVNQYGKNLMSHAYGNLQKNPAYRSLVDSVNGIQIMKNNNVYYQKPDAETDADSCLYCHGTAVQVMGTQIRETDEGDMTFPVLSGWPNQGVGRLNPDGTKGSCTACHTRHQFPVEMARDPYTCAECHNGPDVPAYKVYEVSKHGNIHHAIGKTWNLKSTPWTVGSDFTAPTCAVCHASLLISNDGDIIAQRTHQMNDRLPWRIFGPIYAHAHPRTADTTIIKNKAGLPLPTELTGEPAEAYLIDGKEQAQREAAMKKVCLSCHSLGWVDGHFSRLEKSIATTNEMTLTATKILIRAWNQGVAKGLNQKDSIFNETIEKKWVEQWLFYANSTRFASAMAGTDYGVFANGRWYLSKNIQEMNDWLEFKQK